jgi:hypothetical protein
VAGVEQHSGRVPALDEEIERAEAELQLLVQSASAGIAEIGVLLARVRALHASRDAVPASVPLPPRQLPTMSSEEAE